MAKNKKLTIFLSTIFSLVFSTSLAGATDLTSNNINNTSNFNETKTDTTKNNNDNNDTNKETDTTKDNNKNDNNENVKTINVDKIIAKNIDNNNNNVDTNNNIDNNDNIDTNNNNYDKNNLNYEDENNLNSNENINSIINRESFYTMPSYITNYQNDKGNTDNKTLKVNTVEDTLYDDGSTKRTITMQNINKKNQFDNFENPGDENIVKTSTRQNTEVVNR